MAGRVDVPLGGAALPAFSLFDDDMAGEAGGRGAAGAYARGALQHSTQGSTVADVFFSARNVDALQHGIRYRVFRESGGKLVIGRQSDVELGIVMRSIYLQHARNEERDVLGQVRELNRLVLDFAVPQIVREANLYKHYREDVSRLPVPMARGELATSKGERSLEMGMPGF